MFISANNTHTYYKCQYVHGLEMEKPFTYVQVMLKENLKREMAKRNWSSYDLERYSGIPQPTTQRFLSGKHGEPKQKTIQAWAKAFGLTEGELRGITEKVTVYQNVEPAPEIVGQVPLISWVQAGKFCHTPDNFQPGDAEEWLPTIKRHGPHTYALRVQGDSMVSPLPGARSYPPGSIIYVDPDKPVTNGCRVIVRLNTNETTFKIYSEDSGKKYLKPLNFQYPTIEMTSDMQICGVIVGAWYDD